MTDCVYSQTPDELEVELRPDEHDETMWLLLAHLAEYLWTMFGIPFDCDTVVVRLVYGGEETAQRVPAAPESSAR